MQIPEHALDLPISHYEFRLLAVLCRLAGQEGTVDATVAQLGVLTQGASEKTVRRALEALERHALISRRRGRSAGGRYGVTRYRIQRSPVTSGPAVTHDRSELSTDRLSKLTNDKLIPVTSTTNSNEGTTYPRGASAPLKVIRVKYVDDGEELGGFGLIEGRPDPQAKVKKSDPKTRRKRPQHEWTPADVAAEFSHEVSKVFPWLPGTVNVRNLSGALAKYRTQYKTNALIELELLKLFMQDDRNFHDVGSEAPDLYRRYLKSFTTKMNQARENLGLEKLTAIEEEPTVIRTEMLVASDGRAFPNTMSGRMQLQRHEERLTR